MRGCAGRIRPDFLPAPSGSAGWGFAGADGPDAGRLGAMAGATKQPDIARIERCAAVFQFMDMIAEDPAAGAAAGLATAATMGEKAGHQAAPFGREIDGFRLLRQRRCNTGFDATNRWQDALQFADCHGSSLQKSGIKKDACPNG